MRALPCSSTVRPGNLATLALTLTLVTTLCTSSDATAQPGSGSLQNGGYETIPGGTCSTSVLPSIAGNLVVAAGLFASQAIQVQLFTLGGQQSTVGSVSTSGNGQALAFADGYLLSASAGSNTVASYEVRTSSGGGVDLRLADEKPSGGGNPASMIVLPRRTASGAAAPADRDIVVEADPSTSEIYVFELQNGEWEPVKKYPQAQNSAPIHLDQASIDLVPILFPGQSNAPDDTQRASGAMARSASNEETAPQSVVGVAFSGSNEVGLFAADEDGSLTPIQPRVQLGARPRVVRLSPEGDFVYVALAMPTAQQPNLEDEIRAFRVGQDGKLTLESTTPAGFFLTDFRVFPRGLAAATVNANGRNEIRVFRRQGASLSLDRSLATSPPGQAPSSQQISIARGCGAVESTRILVTEFQASRLGSLLYTPGQPAATPCVTLNQGRFEVRVDWSVPAENRSGVATATAITGDTGYFWFFDPANVELVVKVLDGRSINGNFWVYYGALTDVRYTITITDRQTGSVRTYVNPAGNQASAADIDAFEGSGSASSLVDLGKSAPPALAEGGSLSAWLASLDVAAPGDSWTSSTSSFRHDAPDPAAASSATCAATSTALCLTQGRFEVRVDWSAPGQGGDGNAVPLSADTGYFWFFDAANVELIIKVLDARVINGKFWVYYGALSDVEYTITVTDTVTGSQKTYFNPSGTLGSGADTDAF